jgi:hypothetical protein
MSGANRQSQARTLISTHWASPEPGKQFRQFTDRNARSAGATYMLTDHWSLGAHVSYGKLQGDAADSPVTTDKTQRMYAAFFMYRF